MGSVISSMWTTLFGEVPVSPPPELDCTLPFPTNTDIEHRKSVVGVSQSSSMSCESKDHIASPPELSFTLPTHSDLGTNDHEFYALYAYMNDVQRGINSKLDIVDFGRFGDENDQNVKVALMKSAQGPIEALLAVKNAAEILKPKVILFVGICATMRPKKAKLGDVIISAKLATYDETKIKEDKVEYRGSKSKVSQNMQKRIRHATDGWKAPLKDPSSLKVEVHPDAVMLSGSDLVNNRGRREELAEYFQDALGLEMEGAGLYAAASDLKTEWAVIKAVSDFADGSKSSTEPWQPFSSAMAASVVYNMFKYPVLIQHWPHYNAEDMKGNPPTSPTPSVSIDQFLKSIGGTTEGTKMYNGRTIKYSASGRIHSFDEPWVYDGTATDIASRFSVKENHFETADQAIYAAIQELFKQLKEKKII
ncbi:5 -methylthioadenosine S-adenosylhomocysteine nucleosidase-like isoform X16 [Paramuricea clavata]|uniref:5 -methylthioadenosine S-adenosylhomocysteine nucleosidase-like isoform X16 n=1 Tax=Paramuricea clavata TaxID=317549 RepID=A0A7D9HI05_PARCT|nr:5 -methylthioadenosine S-adenosylhomocysteine nucleosidase-like isoform X16 [Paramuricea clavata]